MFESEDGTVTGSVDRARLEEIQPKTAEAQAQVDALLDAHRAGDEQVAADAQRLADVAAAQNPAARQLPDTRDDRGVETQGRPQGGTSQTAEGFDGAATTEAAPQPEAEQSADGPQGEQPADSADVEQLRAEAEALGVKVDRRWGADRLRAEVDAAREG